MKKLIYMIFGVLLFTAISCEKEIIHPNNTVNNNIDVTNQRGEGLDGTDNNHPQNLNPFDNTNTKTISPTDSTHVITDPNRDDDDIRKTKPN